MENIFGARAFPSFGSKLATRIQKIASLLWSESAPVLFGLRLWASVCLALYVAFWLELDNAYWAGTSAAIVCQPSLGASLRKASYRMVGTIIGAVFIVVLSAAFPQDRAPFLLGLSLWGGVCAVIATILRNFAAYAAALAGYTAAIIAADELGAVGGTNGQVFMLAVWRATEIWIGILAAGLVLAGTDFGSARRRLREQLAVTLAEAGSGLFRALNGEPAAAAREQWRSLLRRVTMLDAVIDEAIGESSEIRHRSGILQDAVDGLFASVSGWIVVANHLNQLPSSTAREDANVVLEQVPAELRKALVEEHAAAWVGEAPRLRRLIEDVSAALNAMPASTPSLRLLADKTALTLGYLSHAVNGVAFLNDPVGAVQWSHRKQLRVPDLLPALVNGLRALLTIGAVSIFWIVTEWTNGAQAIIFAAIVVILLSPRGDLAPTAAISFFLGAILSTAIAAIVKFALLPQLDTFTGFSMALGLVLVPLGAMMAQPWQSLIFLAAAFNFVPILSPANEMTYDTAQFYNTSLAIIAGIGAALLGLILFPQVSPRLRTRRLLMLTLRDFRQIAAKQTVPAVKDWVGNIASRLSVLPDQAKPLQFARLGTALSAGADLIRLRSLASRFGFAEVLHPALEAISHGQSQAAIDALAHADGVLSQSGNNGAGADIRIEARAAICLLSEALSRHGAYFDGRAME